MMKIEIYHPILWSKYKAAVFTQVSRLALREGSNAQFVQVAESERQRVALNTVDLSYHQYPYRLLFKGTYDDIPKAKLASAAFKAGWTSDADLILTPGFSDIAHWALLLAAKLRRKKVATFCDSTLRDRPQSSLKGVLKRTYFHFCDGYFSYGTRGREYLLHYGAKPDRIFRRVQAAGLPAGYSEDAAFSARAGTPPGEPSMPPRPTLLYVGRLSGEKGLDLLLRAFHALLETYPGARLDIAGSGPSANELKAQAEALGITGSVQFLGGLPLDEITARYARADLFVLPSRSEPWGLVVNEALHYGCPVIVSDACGCAPDIVEEGVNGYTFISDDEQDLRAKLELGVRTFADHAATARACLQSVAPFNPAASAAQILAGCHAIMDRAA